MVHLYTKSDEQDIEDSGTLLSPTPGRNTGILTAAFVIPGNSPSAAPLTIPDINLKNSMGQLHIAVVTFETIRDHVVSKIII